MEKIGNLVIRDDDALVIKNVRLSYLYAFKPREDINDQGEKVRKYKVTAILPKDEYKKEIARLQDILTAMQKEAFKTRIPADKLCLRDGDLTGKDEYAGAYILVCSEREENPPIIKRKDGKGTLTPADDMLYSGCFGNVMFRFWAQNNKKGGKRINANFLGVQWMAHGDKFSSVQRPNEDEAFDDEGDDGAGDGFDED